MHNLQNVLGMNFVVRLGAKWCMEIRTNLSHPLKEVANKKAPLILRIIVPNFFFKTRK